MIISSPAVPGPGRDVPDPSISLERKPRADTHLQRILELRRGAQNHLRLGLAEIRVRNAEAQFGPLVVSQRFLRIEQIEDVAEERQGVAALAEFQLV